MKTIAKVKTARELVADLSELLDHLKNKTADPKYAKEMNNTAGKIISVHRDAMKQEVEARRKPNLPFYRSITK